MKRQISLANSIDVTNRQAQYDEACKKLLSNKQILAWILKTTVKEFETCSIEDIAQKYIEGTPEVSKVLVNPGETNANITGLNNEDSVFREGKITYDIRFQAVYPKSGEYIKLFINVEAQKNFYPGYDIPKRGIFYCSRMISSQYLTEFEEPHYNNIRKVYSIWICMNPSKKVGNTITRYQMEKEDLIGSIKDNKEQYDLLSVIMICLGGEKQENYNGILKLLDVLLSQTKTPETKKEILQKEYQIAMNKELEKESEIMCNLGQGLLEQGLKQGRNAERIMLIRKLLKIGNTKEQISNLLELDISYLETVEKLLKENPSKSETELAILLSQEIK